MSGARHFPFLLSPEKTKEDVRTLEASAKEYSKQQEIKMDKCSQITSKVALGGRQGKQEMLSPELQSVENANDENFGKPWVARPSSISFFIVCCTPANPDDLVNHSVPF